MDHLDKLIRNLCALTSEQTWLEFKHNNENPELIAKNISALANAAAYDNRENAYIVWGIEDKTHAMLGTTFNPFEAKEKGQELENWLRGHLSSNCEFRFYMEKIEEKNFVVLCISRAIYQPVKFKKNAYIKVGTYTKELKDVPSMEATLWDRLKNLKFEDMLALKDLAPIDALNKLDYHIYFEHKEIPLPTAEESILHYMLEEEIVKKQDNGLFAITNLGAILFAKKTSEFSSISRKTVRLVQYADKNKFEILKTINAERGYLLEFSGIMNTLEILLPSREVFQGAQRLTEMLYPKIALRELIANALIHQDFSVTGSSITIEIFEDRIEITNPGTPLVDTYRIIDNPPKSRNEKLSSLMRNLKMCEELGSGWDRTIIACEREHLFAPRIELYDEHTKITLFAKRNFTEISHEDKIWTCYLHACIKHINGDSMTNSSLRERFGLDEKASSNISRLIKETLRQNLIKALDPNTAPKHMKYIPIWA